jgi:hypothetical protein
VTFASFVRGVNSFGFTRTELRTLRALKTPAGVQRFLDELPYNLSYTARSPQKVLRDRTASCLEGGIFGAAALRVLGFPPLIFDLEADQDTDHVVAIFKVRGRWGAVAKSNFTGCRYREPVYRSLRELAMSYFNIYFNLRGERTLRRQSGSSPNIFAKSRTSRCSRPQWKNASPASIRAPSAAKWSDTERGSRRIVIARPWLDRSPT